MRDDAVELVKQLSARGLRIVFAESCTGGMVASELAKIPGVSQWLCGSAVTYRGETKVSWLGVNTNTLAAHSAVSSETTAEMVKGVLQRTPEASIGASVTGHLGPDAPKNLDGVVYTAIAIRDQRGIDVASAASHRLKSGDREVRQRETVTLVLQHLLDYLNRH
jgi:PncC family amidohydrolase